MPKNGRQDAGATIIAAPIQDENDVTFEAAIGYILCSSPKAMEGFLARNRDVAIAPPPESDRRGPGYYILKIDGNSQRTIKMLFDSAKKLLGNQSSVRLANDSDFVQNLEGLRHHIDFVSTRRQTTKSL